VVERISEEEGAIVAKSARESDILTVEEVFAAHADGVAQAKSTGRALIPRVAKTGVD